MRGALLRALLVLAVPVLVFGSVEATLWLVGAPVRADDARFQRLRFMQRCRMPPADKLHATCSAKPPPDASRKKRVYVFGGSSAAPGARGERSFPAQIRNRLAARFPGRFEIRNFASPCKDSIYVRRCASLSLAGRPDAVIIYSGHNDFANFVSSSPRLMILLEEHPWIGSIDYALAHTRTYSALASAAERTGVREAGVAWRRLDPASYERAIEIALAEYTRNLSRVLDETAALGIPVVLVTVVSNLYDYPVPLAEWDESKAAEVDSSAESWRRHYEAGALAFGERRLETARTEFELARDAFLFGRAPGVLNDRVRELAASHPHARLVDFEAILARNPIALEEGIGCNFFGAPEGCDQFHPNTRTHAMIAEAVINTLLPL